MAIPILSWRGGGLQCFQFGSSAFTFVVEQIECFPSLGRGHFGDYRIVQRRLRILGCHRSCPTAIGEEAFACLFVTQDFDFIRLYVGFELSDALSI